MSIFQTQQDHTEYLYIKSRNIETISLSPEFQSHIYITLGEQSKLTLSIESGQYDHHITIVLTKGSVCNIQELNPWSGHIHWEIYLIEPYASIDYLTRIVHHQEQHNTISIHHQSSYTQSHIDSRYSSHSTAKLYQYVSISIPQGVMHCTASQSASVLLNTAYRPHISIIPELKVATDQSQARHGVSIQPISELDIFYLMSRGLTEQEAKQEIEKGFLEINLTKNNKRNII
jgi:hypothetical protein